MAAPHSRAADGYRYGGKEHDKRPAVAELLDGLTTVRQLLTVEHLFFELLADFADFAARTAGKGTGRDAQGEPAGVGVSGPLRSPR
ncbi:hypothetical protein [Streptomyces pristinaespiralis]|uniref:hypothetical protein n=1 Tax=Streptomyces pristinaespiralis TaxID=38300 RepID=UPI0033F91DB5